MYPVIFELGPIKLYSFGLMMAVAFMAANYYFVQELKRRKLDESLAWSITIRALIGGVAGSKLFSILENWSDFARDPLGTIFSPAGLTFYGGFIVALVVIFFYLKKQKFPFFKFADMIIPTVLLAYGIGRIGCHLAGDGDYGLPSRLPWAMAYPQGTAKVTSTLPEYFERDSVARAEWHYDSLRVIQTGVDQLGHRITRLDESVTVHPTPVYEALFCIFAFAWLWRRRAKYELQPGKMFYVTLMIMGVERLLIEFIRLNPLYAGLSQAQWISVLFIIVSIFMLMTKYKGDPPMNVAPATKTSKPARA
jgi:phosphatidylglycerol:prolipoprotein diacylglycerol transferase